MIRWVQDFCTDRKVKGSDHLRERAIQETFERNFLECLQRPSICREELKLSSLSYTQDFGIVTQLYPGRRSTQRLARALREDDCSNNPYLKWSRRDILSALQNRQIAISEPDSESRCKCRLALKVADKTATFHFLELPKEVRMLVYEQALLHQGVFKHDSHAPPALLQINQQVRQESREIFFSINCFRLRTRRCIIRRSDKTAKTHQTTKAPWTVGQQIEKSDKKKKWLDSCCSNPEILILYTKALEEEIRTRDSAQMAMNGFGERYGKGKSVKPTIEGLELLGGCIMQNFGHVDESLEKRLNNGYRKWRERAMTVSR
ncbi:hypothetical protein D6D08_10327 [Aureobasidium pullulans]|nr:hypothetical protein D6D08_10327 [Aureobasidium pullulans]